MSPPESPINLTPEAADDLEHILLYTASTWGDEQMLAYADKIDSAFTLIAEHPALGHTTSALSDLYRLHFVGSHVIVYRVEDKGLLVVRILHQRMSLSLHI